MAKIARRKHSRVYGKLGTNGTLFTVIGANLVVVVSEAELGMLPSMIWLVLQCIGIACLHQYIFGPIKR